MNVILACSDEPSELWEKDWLSELFNGIETEIKWYTDNDLSLAPMKNAVIVFNVKSTVRGEQIAQYLQRYEDQGVHYVLIHLSDEFYSWFDYMQYMNKYCTAVFRNYWHPQLQAPHLHTFALGYKRGFWDGYTKEHPSVINGNSRTLTWCFAGNVSQRHPDRHNCITLFADTMPHKLVIEVGDSFSNVQTGLSTSDYRDMFLAAKFALCPIGNINMDTFRIYEALECGCIPVVTKRTSLQDYEPSYWVHLFGVADEREIPFVLADTWDDCKRKVNEIVSNPQAYEDMRGKVNAFWMSYKQRLKGKFHEVFRMLNSKSSSL
jgi:hypothetical protein